MGYLTPDMGGFVFRSILNQFENVTIPNSIKRFIKEPPKERNWRQKNGINFINLNFLLFLCVIDV